LHVQTRERDWNTLSVRPSRSTARQDSSNRGNARQFHFNLR
jgi:hypothetical protein